MTPDNKRKRLPILIEGLGWMLIGGTLLFAGLFLLGYLVTSGDKEQVGLPLEVLLILGIGIPPAIGLLRAKLWAWFVVGLGCLMLALVRLSATATMQVTGGASPLPQDARFSSTALWIGTGLIALFFGAIYAGLQLRGTRDAFGLERPFWQPLAIQLVVALAVSIAVIWPALTAPEPQVSGREMLLREIGEALGNTDSDLEILLAGLAEGSDVERAVAAWSLGRSGRPESIEPLIDAADNDENSDVRINAIAALVELDFPELGAALGRWIEDDDAQVRNAALRGLADAKFSGAAATVAKLLDDADPALQTLAIDVLGRMGDPSVAPQLATLVDHEDADIRSRVAFAMGKLKDSRVVEPLSRMLDDESWEVRANAAQALGMIGDPAAVPALEKRREDPNGMVRDAVAASLQRLGG